MFKISLDQPQNCVVIVYSGHVGPEETNQCVEAIRTLVADAKPGFRLLVDLTDLQAMEVGCAPHIRSLMDTCNQNGVSQVIRVIPNPRLDIGFQIMSHFHYGGDVHIVTCENMAEARELLGEVESC